MGISILGTGSNHPKFCVKNDDFTKIETSDEWIYSRTGIKQRYFAKSETTSSMAIEASKIAIKNANIIPSDISLVIVATMTPDSFTPCVASKILSELGISKAAAFDINVACSGFVYALSVAEAMLKEGYALVIGSECVSKVLDFNDRSSCVLFGDGAGAMIVQRNNLNNMSYLASKTDEDMVLEATGLSQIRTGHTLKNFKLKMNGTEVFKFALDAFNDCFIELEKSGVDINDIDLIIPHQANKRIIISVSKRNDIPEEKFFLNLEKYGNTSSASIAIAFDEANKAGLIKKGMKVLLVGFGSGLSWGYYLLEI